MAKLLRLHKNTTILGGMAEHNELGKAGEDIAAEFLRIKGFDIQCRNYRFKHLEIDIIAQDKDELVIVEVKTRTSDYLSEASLTVSKNKQKGVIKAANNYIIENEIDLECRFDIITVILNSKGKEIEHIQAAFQPGL